MIWTALQYDVNGLLTCLAFDAVPLKHCLDILVLHFIAVTMQQPMKHHHKDALSRLPVLLSCSMMVRSWQC